MRSRPILLTVAVATVCFAWFVPQIEIDTRLRSFIRPAAQQLSDTIEDEFGEGSYLTLIFESQSAQSLLAPKLLHQQLLMMREIKGRFRVRTTYSLVEGVNESLMRIKRKSLLDYDDFTPIAEGIVSLSGGRTVRDLERVSRHFLSHPEAIGFYGKLRVAGGIAPAPPPEYRISPTGPLLFEVLRP